MTTPIRAVQLVTAGLDVLHATRLKLACSLLLADRIDVTLREWRDAGDAHADLVVAGQEPDARDALVALRGSRQLLAIRRDARDNAIGELQHGATVRDIHERLRLLLQAGQPTVATQRPLLVQAILAPDAHRPQQFVLGDCRIVFDPARACLQLPHALGLDTLLDLLARHGWSQQPLAAAQDPALPRQLSVEALLFAVADRHPDWLPPAPGVEQPLQLRQWPDLAGEAAPAGWLVAIAQLHARPWRADALANACRLPAPVVDSLFAAATASGLAHFQETALPTPNPRRSASSSRFLSWVARRFGLSLVQAAA